MGTYFIYVPHVRTADIRTYIEEKTTIVSTYLLYVPTEPTRVPTGVRTHLLHTAVRTYQLYLLNKCF